METFEENENCGQMNLLIVHDFNIFVTLLSRYIISDNCTQGTLIERVVKSGLNSVEVAFGQSGMQTVKVQE